MSSLATRTLLAAALLAFTPFASRADDLAAAPPADYTNPHPDRYLFEDQLKPGMKGYGLTVMRGAKIERFDVEIIDVMKNFAPEQNEILVKCTGLGLEESGIIAGMSGSPCYINDKLIGAVAYGWGGAKEPIGGVQPIRQMLSIPTGAAPSGATLAPGAANAGGPRNARTRAAESAGLWSPNSPLAKAALARPGWSALAKHLIQQNPQSASTAHPSSLTPLATPLMVSNSSPQSLAYLQSMLAGTGLIPLQSGGGGSGVGDAPRLGGLATTPDAKLQLAPGSAIAIPLISGDIDMSAIGTVTLVEDHKIWAFGHAMFADGPSQLPISTGYIYTILPSISTSFKIGSCVAPAGTLAADENTGIVGFTGKSPAMIPVTLTLLNSDGSNKHVFHYNIVQHPKMTTEVLGSAINGSIVAQRNLPLEYTLDIKATADFGPVKIPLRSLSTTDEFDISDILLPIGVLTDNPFHNLTLDKIELTATITPKNTAAQIRRIHLDRLTVAPGDTLTATVDFAAFHQPVQSQTLTLNIPADAPEGDFELLIGSAGAMLKNDVETTPHIADPENISALLSTVNHITSYNDDHLYARLVLDLQGAAIAGRPRPALPASRLALLSSDRQTGITPIIRTITTNAPTPAIFTAAAETLHITIAKDADKRYHEESTTDFPSESPKPPSSILGPKKPPKEPTSMD